MPFRRGNRPGEPKRQVIDDDLGMKQLGLRSSNLSVAVLDALPDGVLVVSADGVIAHANERAAELLGFRVAELVGMPVEELVPESARGRHAELRADFAARSAVRSMARGRGLSARRKDGQIVAVDINLAPISLESGPHVVAVIRDSSERDPEALLVVERIERQRALIEASAAGLLVFQDDRIVFANPAVEQLTGYLREELYRLSVSDVVEPRVYETMVERALARQRGEAVPAVAEYPIIRKDGEVRLIEVRVTQTQYEGRPALVGTCFDVTERRADEDDLARLWSAIEASVTAITMADLNGVLTYANRAALELWGYAAAEEVLGREGTTFWESPQAAAAVMAEVRETGAWTGEGRAKRRDGTLVDVEMATTLFRDARGEPLGLLGTYVDVSGRKQAEERYHELFETATDIILVADGDGRIVAVNPAGEEILGYRHDELRGRRYLDLVAPGDLERSDSEIREKLAGAVTLSAYDASLVRKDGTEVTIEWRSRPVVVDGRVVGTWGIGRDVTVHRRMVEQLRVTGELLARAQARARLGSWEVGPDGTHRWSEETFRIVGLDPSTIPCRETYLELVHPDDRERAVAAGVGNAIAGGTGFDLEYRIVRPDGDVRIVHDRADLDRDAEGNVVRVVGTIQDVTERRRLEAQLRQAQKMEVVGRLAGGIAHDFNNILTAIGGYSQLLRDQLGDDPAAREDVDQIRRATERGATLTRQLLAFSRKQVLERHAFDLGDALHDMEGMLSRLIGEDVELRFETVAGLPPVYADPGQIEQVVLNLVVNAREAMPRGGAVTLRTARGALGGGPAVMLSVSDTGDGIPPEVMDHLFEPFFTTKEKGTGLGLATVYGIVEQTGGSVSVSSEVGSGATFSVVLPVADAAVVEHVPSEPELAPLGKGETVLLVEDEEAVRALSHRLLEQQGYRVIVAAGPEEALATARALGGRLDLVVSDVVMPGMSGPEFVERLAALREGFGVVYVSGYTKDAISRHGLPERGVMFLQKPFTREALARTVRRTLDERPA